MFRSRCLRSCAVSSILVSVIIISQLLFSDDSSDDEIRLRDSAVVTDPRDTWDRRRAVESFSLLCPNCTFLNQTAANRTSDSDIMRMHETYNGYLRQHVHQLNRAQVVRNLDKYDLQEDNDASLVIVVQVS